MLVDKQIKLDFKFHNVYPFYEYRKIININVGTHDSL